MAKPRETIGGHADVTIALGDAPDGLPLVLGISRFRPLEDAVLSALGVGGRDELAPPVDDALGVLEAAAGTAASEVGIEEMEDVGRLYRSSATVGSLLGPTLFARTLGAHSPLVLTGQGEELPNTTAVTPSPRPITVMKGPSSVRHLAVPLGEGPVFTVELDSRDQTVRVESLQPLLFESLRALPSAQFHCREESFALDGELADPRAYERAARRADRMSWSVERGDLGRALVELARGLQAFHDEGRVHCDVKTGNALITPAGTAAIDPLGVLAGEVSPGATPGWAAPEQLLARPVSPESDVYSLGLMAALLVDAAICGEERTFLIPVGGGERRRIQLLVLPEVFMAPSNGVLDEVACRDFAELIARCLALDPGRRPACAAAFADELAALLERCELSDRLPVPGGPGQLSRDVEVRGTSRPSWVIEDVW